MSNDEQLKAAELVLADEWPHEPGPDAAWQESVFFTMQDVGSGVAATFRIGHEPNNGIGHCCFSITTSSGVGYQRSNRDIPMSASDRSSTGFAIDDFVSATFENGTCRWVANDSDCSVDLTFEDEHQRYNIMGLMADPKAKGAKHETEENFASSSIAMSGRVRGTIKIGDASWNIDGVGSRDHSWGNRHVRIIKNWAWLTGGFGSDLSFAGGASLLRGGNYAMRGFVLQDGKLGRIVDGNVVLGIEMDGISARDARIHFVTDELGEFEFQAKGFAPNMLLDLGDTYNEAFMPCELTYKERKSAASLGFSFNPRDGAAPVEYYHNAVHQNGITTIPVRREL